MANAAKTQPRAGGVGEFLDSVEPPRRRAQGLALLDLFVEETGAEPVLWGPSIVGFGALHYQYASGHSGEMARVGFSPRKASLVLYGLSTYGSNADLLVRLGKHRLGKGCLYLNRLEDVDLEVLRLLIRCGWDAGDRDFEESHPGVILTPAPVTPATAAGRRGVRSP